MNKETYVNLSDFLAEIKKKEVKSQVSDEKLLLERDILSAINCCRKLEVGR